MRNYTKIILAGVLGLYGLLAKKKKKEKPLRLENEFALIVIAWAVQLKLKKIVRCRKSGVLGVNAVWSVNIGIERESV